MNILIGMVIFYFFVNICIIIGLVVVEWNHLDEETNWGEVFWNVVRLLFVGLPLAITYSVKRG